MDESIEIVAVTRAGARLAARLVTALPGARALVPARFVAEVGAGVTGYEVSAASLVATLFPRCRGLVMIMAAGAAVRLVAPHLRDKTRDPAVVVVDDGGRFAIALLSGHVGGANVLAERLAGALGAQPVITTASEARGAPAPDLIGRAFGWRVENPAELKPLAAALVNGEPVGLYQDAGEPDWHDAPLPQNISRYESIDTLVAHAPAGAIIITDRVVPDVATRPGWVLYRPPTLALGVGCSRGVSESEIKDLATRALRAYGLSPLSLYAVATIDVKRDEAGLLAFAKHQNLPLHCYSASALDGVAGQQHPSEIVRAAVGTRGVCEPAALLCAGATELLVPKHKGRAVTVAVARRAAPSPGLSPAQRGRGRALVS
jgi:cobalamin biosynthesis protein CbiG